MVDSGGFGVILAVVKGDQHQTVQQFARILQLKHRGLLYWVDGYLKLNKGRTRENERADGDVRDCVVVDRTRVDSCTLGLE